jgi:CcmD family protein
MRSNKAFAQSNLMENWSYLCAAYSIIFAAIFLYVMFLWRRQARLDNKLRRLEAQVSKVQEDLAENGPAAPRSVSRSAS